jgi:hypothetical protein
MSERRCGPYLFLDGAWKCKVCGEPAVAPSCDSRPRITADEFRRNRDAVLARAGSEGVVVTDDEGNVVGVVSNPTESDELAAIRADVTSANWMSLCPAPYAGRLRERDELRKQVDELTANQNYMHECAQFQMRAAEAAEKERDELEAKLADSEAAWRTWNTNMSIEASKWEQRCGELEAKLADAEKRWAEQTAMRSDWRERAEAAEKDGALWLNAYHEQHKRAEAVAEERRERAKKAELAPEGAEAAAARVRELDNAIHDVEVAARLACNSRDVGEVASLLGNIIETCAIVCTSHGEKR